MSDLLKIKNHFDGLAGNLGKFSYRHEFTMNAVRLKIVMEILSNLPKGDLLDLGCGEAYTTCEFLKAGWNASGLELSQRLVDGGKEYLVNNGYSSEIITTGSATDLSVYPENSFDIVTCLGVAYYIEDQDRLYKEVSRVLRKGGIFICSHQNELFSLFTFNKYTIQFFSKYVFLGSEGKESLEKFKTLITHPDEPRKHESGSARDELELYPENPLTISAKLKNYSLIMDRPIIYHGWHEMPPLLMGEKERVQSEKDDENHTADWRSIFMAAHFLVTSIKV